MGVSLLGNRCDPPPSALWGRRKGCGVGGGGPPCEEKHGTKMMATLIGFGRGPMKEGVFICLPFPSSETHSHQ